MAKSEAVAAQQVQESVDDLKTSAALKATTNAGQGSSTGTLDVQQTKELATSNAPLNNLSDSPAATATANLQMKTQPEKQPDVPCINTSAPLPAKTTQSTTSTTNTALEKTRRPYEVNDETVPSKMDRKSCNKIESNVKPSTPPAVGLNSSDNNPIDTQGHPSILPEAKPTSTADTADEVS